MILSLDANRKKYGKTTVKCARQDRDFRKPGLDLLGAGSEERDTVENTDEYIAYLCGLRRNDAAVDVRLGVKIEGSSVKTRR